MLRHERGVLREEEGEAGGSQGDLFKEEPKAEPKSDDRVAKLERELKETRGALAQFLQQRPQPQQRQQDPDDQRRKMEEQFLANPVGMAAQMAQYAAAQQAAQVRGELLPMQMKAARNEARDSDPDVFDKYQSEVQEWVQRTYPHPEHQANPFVWKQGLASVKAEKLDEIAAYKAERKKAAAAAAAPSRRGYSPEESEAMDSDQKLAARIFGFTEEEYKAANKNYRTDLRSPYEGREMLNSDAAKHLTFDSRKPRQKRTA